jgi:hypothetical protein
MVFHPPEIIVALPLVGEDILGRRFPMFWRGKNCS